MLSCYDGLKIDRLLAQLAAPQHRPMAVDDLRGERSLGLDIRQDLFDRDGGCALGSDHHLKRMGVVHHRAEGLSKLMRDRTGQRRHRLAPAGVGGQRQVPAAFDLCLLARAALVQKSGNQQRLDQQRAGRAQHRELVFAPQAGTSKAHDAARREPALGDAPPLKLAPVEYGRLGCCGGTLMLAGDSPSSSRPAASAVLRASSSSAINVPPTIPEPRYTLQRQTSAHSPGYEYRRARAHPRTRRPARRCRS